MELANKWTNFKYIISEQMHWYAILEQAKESAEWLPEL